MILIAKEFHKRLRDPIFSRLVWVKCIFFYYKFKKPLLLKKIYSAKISYREFRFSYIIFCKFLIKIMPLQAFAMQEYCIKKEIKP